MVDHDVGIVPIQGRDHGGVRRRGLRWLGDSKLDEGRLVAPLGAELAAPPGKRAGIDVNLLGEGADGEAGGLMLVDQVDQRSAAGVRAMGSSCGGGHPGRWACRDPCEVWIRIHAQSFARGWGAGRLRAAPSRD